jgi:hypothetical protein
MKKLLYVGGPLILFTWFSFHSDFVTFGNQNPGIIHFGGVEPGGTYALVQEDTYVCDENGNNCTLVDSTTEVSEVADGGTPAGVSQSANYRLEEQSTGFANVVGLEFETEPIEYREGDEPVTKTKQPGLTKFGNITMRRPSGFSWESFKFDFPDFQTESGPDTGRDPAGLPPGTTE